MNDIAAHKSIAPTTSNNDDFLPEFSSICIEKLGEDVFRKWLSPLKIFSQSENEVIFSAPSKFIRDWVMREFDLKKLLHEIRPQIKKISVIYVPIAEIEQQVLSTESEQKIVNLSKYDNVFAFGCELNQRYNFQNFVSAKYNKLAVSMAKIAAGIDAQINLFDDKIPLFIHGGVGMGKTHLAQAIAWQIREYNKSKRTVYLSAEKFMYHFVQSIRNNDVMSFKEKMRSIDVLIMDDVQFIAGKASTQQEFMNCFNTLVEENKQVVLVCDRCPSDLTNIDEKLKSRISGGMVINFKNADYADRLMILKSKAEITGEKIPEEVLSFVAEKINTSIRDLEGALKKLLAGKIFDQCEITIENAKEVLADYVRKSNSCAPNIDKIQKIVADFYGIKISDLISKSRERSITRPRQIAMYLTKNFTSESLPKIGQNFGGRNHATVIHAVKLISQMINKDHKILQEVKSLEEKIKS
ncbi:MAG: hypothetical protein A2887_00940 [Alphaproteobacteria bacterium RIFCSPLOWO2_01_FULL_40_26]|nr:MAG: hypothetical protein A3D15_04645 [Alphaproteobacteria bacterium RIFCSPHIGHO2_02_FULL_40_34]OFW88635.1 MAG: hypothetical protein A2794_04965 [Alphaproteobacteria bacterium RIFCSPHIGHO2_01_FULL_40_8]OFW95472.1 MAG: hypothetical protein A2887_00940 [Alphaproteobacteria bacterium RIFCSPLOWO2_01_FULL_40_26]OFX10270.1 MAG: hypothetical protein A3H30_00920 [Alphaproteobacteria bacterium RIFCSPLOWO2_02_FULL_40_19]OFX11607.1 MAG: hypothetical protein A3G22_04800 [Alphaproteobacteria bacterium RI